MLILIVGQVQLLATVGQRSPASCWLSPRGYSQLYRPPTLLAMWFLPSLSQQTFPMLPISDFPSLTSRSRFKGSGPHR